MGKIGGSPDGSPVPFHPSKAPTAKKGFFAALFETISSFFSRSYTGVGWKWEDHKLQPLSPSASTGTTLKTHLVAYLKDGVFKFHNLDLLMPKPSDDLFAIRSKLRALDDIKKDLPSLESDKATKELNSFIQRIESRFKPDFQSFLAGVENFCINAEKFSNYDLDSSAYHEFKKAATTYLFDEKKGLEAFKVLAKKHPLNMDAFLKSMGDKKFLNADDHKQLAGIAASTWKDLEAKRLMDEQRLAQQVTNTPKEAKPPKPLKKTSPPPASRAQAGIPPSAKPTRHEVKKYERIDELTDNDVAVFLFPQRPDLQQKYNRLCEKIFDKPQEVRLQALKELANEHPQDMRALVNSINNFGNDRFKNPFFHRWFDGKYAKFSEFKKFVLHIPYPSSSFQPRSHSYTSPQYSAPLTNESELDRLPEFVTKNLNDKERHLIIEGKARCYLYQPDHGWAYYILKKGDEILKTIDIPTKDVEKRPSRWDD